MSQARSTRRPVRSEPGRRAVESWRLLFSHTLQLNQPSGGYGAVHVDGTRLENHPLGKMEPAHSHVRPAVYRALSTVAGGEVDAGEY